MVYLQFMRGNIQMSNTKDYEELNHNVADYVVTKLNFAKLQREVGAWSRKNFPNNTPENPFLGMVEELGELAHALLKAKQGIRGTAEQHEAAAKDAIGDLLVYMADFCERKGWSMQEIIESVWAVVKQRDWTKNKKDGS